MGPFLFLCGMRKITFLGILMIGFLSCAQNQQAKAVIFERKEVGNGQLAVAYIFTIDGRTFIDSAQIENKALLNDTLNIVFPVGNPAQSTPKILNR